MKRTLQAAGIGMAMFIIMAMANLPASPYGGRISQFIYRVPSGGGATCNGTTVICVTQSGAGTQDGSSAANAHSMAWLNTSGNWAASGSTSKVEPGDTVLRSGSITTDLTVAGSGTAGNIITIDDTSATLSAVTTVQGRSYVTLKNSTWATNFTGSGSLFQINSSDHIVMDGCYADGYFGRGVFFGLTSTMGHDLTLRNCYLRTSSSGSAGENDIIATEGSHDVLIEGNYLELRLTNNTEHIDTIQTFAQNLDVANSPYNWTIRYNKMVLNTTTSLNNKSWFIMEMLQGGTTYIYGNLMIGSTGATETAPAQVDATNDNLFVYNNTVVGKSSGTGGAGLFFSDGDGTKMTAKNNIDYAAGGQELTCCNISTAVLGYDLFNGSSGAPSCTDHCSTSNPLFTNVSTDDYTLQAGSPAKGTGLVIANVGSHTFNSGPCSTATWPNPSLCTRNATVWDMGAFVMTP